MKSATTRRSFFKGASISSLLLGAGCAPVRYRRTSALAGPAPDPWTQISVTRSEPGRWEDYSSEREPTAIVVQAVRYTLSQATVAPDADLIVIADQLSIVGAVSIPGRSVTLCARQIICQADSAIDCSGAVGPPGQLAANPGDTAKAGQDGAVGAKGGNGGAITMVAFEVSGPLLIRSNGGAGAKGQAGGNGGVGQTGDSGQDGDGDNNQGPGSGFRGGTGGRGGSGGAGGPGGDSGVIVVRWVQGSAPAVESKAGTGGGVGDPGNGGPGGPGGPPGNNCATILDYYDNGQQGSHVYCWPAAQNGPQGYKGDSGPKKNADGPTGMANAPDARQGGTDELAPYFPITQAYMALSDSELKFINQQLDGLGAALTWLTVLAASPHPGDTFESERAKRLGRPGITPGKQEWQALGARASTLLDRLNLGLDAFGYPPNYLSDLNHVLLDKEAELRSSVATAIETAHDKYAGIAAKSADKIAGLNEALATIKDGIVQKTQDKADAVNEATTAEALIETMSASIEEMKRDLLVNDTNFQNAVLQQGSCDVISLVTFVAGLYAVAVGFVGGYLALADSLAKLKSGSGDANFVSQIKIIKDSFDKAKLGDDLDSIRKGFNEIKNSLQTSNAKIVVSLDSFEKQLEPYMKLDAAKQYRDLMRSFADLCKARNGKQIDYTKLVLTIADTQAQIDSLTLEAGRTQDALVQFANPALAQCQTYLENYLASAKRRLVEILDLQRRALNYVTLKPIQLTYSWGTVAQLDKARLDLSDTWINGLQSRGGAEQPYQAVHTLTRTANPHLFSRLNQGLPGVFTIPLDQPSFGRGGTSFVTVHQVDMAVPGLSSHTGSFTCRLTHGGDSTLADQAGNVLNFVHKLRPTNLSYTQKAGVWQATVDIPGNLRGSEQEYIYLSPFASWELYFEPEDQVNLHSVTAIILTFGASMIPSNAPRVELRARRRYLRKP